MLHDGTFHNSAPASLDEGQHHPQRVATGAVRRATTGAAERMADAAGSLAVGLPAGGTVAADDGSVVTREAVAVVVAGGSWPCGMPSKVMPAAASTTALSISRRGERGAVVTAVVLPPRSRTSC